MHLLCDATLVRTEPVAARGLRVVPTNERASEREREMRTCTSNKSEAIVTWVGANHTYLSKIRNAIDNENQILQRLLVSVAAQVCIGHRAVQVCKIRDWPLS
jgi:hypothetical protein